MKAKEFHIGNQVIGRIGAQLDGGIAGMWCATTAAALIKEHNAIRLGIERLPHSRDTAGTGPAMDGERGLSVWIAARFPVDAVAVPNIQHARFVRLDRRI